MRKTTLKGRAVLAAAAGALVAIVGGRLLFPSILLRMSEKNLQWEYLKGEEGTDLQRLKTPNGWLIEGADGYLVTMNDPKHEWLEEEEEGSLGLFDDTRCAK